MKTTRLMTALFLSVLFAAGCKDKEKVACEEAYSRMYSETFRGLIYVCNAQPPHDTTVHGTATVSAVSDSEVSIHLVGDSSYIDTTFFRETSCRLAETNGIIFIQSSIVGHDDDQYNLDPDRISISWEDPNCPNWGNFFEGSAQ